MKRILVILIILIMLAGAGVYGYQYLQPAEPKSLAEDPMVEIVPVGRETLVDTVNATGSIEPEAEVEMKFETGGMVKEVLGQGRPICHRGNDPGPAGYRRPGVTGAQRRD